MRYECAKRIVRVNAGRGEWDDSELVSIRPVGHLLALRLVRVFD